MRFIDVESCGFYGLPVLIQHAKDDGEVELYSIWTNRVIDTLLLIESFCEEDICGFNLAFDWFMLSKIYTTLLLCDPDWYPVDHIEEIALLEEKARWTDVCIKPKRAMDLMLHARKGPFQSLMARKPIVLKKIPNALADQVRDTLEQRISIPDIYFAKKKKGSRRWALREITNKKGEVDENFLNIVLKFAASAKLKDLAEFVLKIPKSEISRFADVELADFWKPNELGYAPYALAVGKPGRWNGAWPEKIHQHIRHWGFYEPARKYARADVVYTRKLWEYFGKPEPGDNDSELACAVASCRWHGFAIDLEKLAALKKAAKEEQEKIPQAPGAVLVYLRQVMDEDEAFTFGKSTAKVHMEEIAKEWKIDCSKCKGEGCEECNGSGEIPHPVAIRCLEVLSARKAKKVEELADKLLLAKRFHASFVVIGTKSSRMSGTDKLNAQGIGKTTPVRECFTLVDPGHLLSAGDFDAFEVVLIDAAFPDPKLHADLLSGKKIHALFGEELHPELTYEDIVKTKGTKEDLYWEGKQAVFSQAYGGNEMTIHNKLGISIERAKKASDSFAKKYPDMAAGRKKIFDAFCSMTQPEGIGKEVIWKDPANEVESLLGFKRSFAMENRICKTIFELAQTPPREWDDCKIRVNRRGREQTAAGAVRSALYACAFQLQEANKRAAANHRIQATGADITKDVQRKIWDLQPSGVHSFRVQHMNVHDSVLCCTKPEAVDAVAKVVHDTVESYRERVPLIKLKWMKSIGSWAEC